MFFNNKNKEENSTALQKDNVKARLYSGSKQGDLQEKMKKKKKGSQGRTSSWLWSAQWMGLGQRPAMFSWLGELVMCSG